MAIETTEHTPLMNLYQREGIAGVREVADFVFVVTVGEGAGGKLSGDIDFGAELADTTDAQLHRQWALRFGERVVIVITAGRTLHDAIEVAYRRLSQQGVHYWLSEVVPFYRRVELDDDAFTQPVGDA